MWVQSLGWEDPLEKKMATHSSILAWKIPWTEEPGGLQSLRSQKSDLTEATELKDGVKLSLSDYTATGNLLGETHTITFCSSSRKEKEACRDPLKSGLPTFSPLSPSPTILHQ